MGVDMGVGVICGEKEGSGRYVAKKQQKTTTKGLVIT